MDRDLVTVTVRVRGRLYTYTHVVDRTCPTSDAEREALAEVIWRLQQQRVDYTAADLDTARYLWIRNGRAITRAER